MKKYLILLLVIINLGLGVQSFSAMTKEEKIKLEKQIQEAYEKNDEKKALLLVAKYVKEFPNNADYLNRLGVLYTNQKNYSEAEKWYLKAIEKGNFTAISNIAYLYFEKGKLIDNFSKERISNIRKLIAKLENKMSKNDNVIKSKATNTQIPNVSPKLNSKRGFSQNNFNREKFEKNKKKSDDNFTKNIGIGLTAVGGLVTVTSLFTGLGVKTLVGVAIAGAGIIILISENK